MDDAKEKLIEILDRLFIDYGAQAIYFTDQECEDIADNLISNGVTVQKHGRWETHPHLYGYVRCSECHDCIIWGEWADGEKWKYCPHCGVKMDGETK